MDNPVFVDEENIPMVHEDEDDYDSYKTQAGLRQTLWLRQKV